MQFLNSLFGGLCALALVVGAPAASTTNLATQPPPDPDHGVNNSTHYTLWSGDVDEGPSHQPESWSNRSTVPMQELAQRTDVPHESPPKAVERWNQGDLDDFPATSVGTSIHPPNATRTNGTFVQDATASIFTVQPSTRVHRSPTTRPLYVAPNGTVLGTVDYRVDLPDDNTSGDRQVSWTLSDHRIEAVRLVVDGTVENKTEGTHTPEIGYTSLAAYPGELHTVTLVAEITVVVQKEVKTCSAQNGNGECPEWNVTVEQLRETVTVRDSVDVVEYDLAVSGFKARYPNGDLGLVVYKNHPWRGYSLPNGNVRGVWRFYAARNANWDTLVTSTESGETVIASSLQPLQVHAYPTETGPTAVPRHNVTLLDTYGSTANQPSLPTNVHLQVVNEPYTTSYGIATRSRASERHHSTVTATGLVRGVNAEVREPSFVDLPINESRLTLSVVNRTEETVTVAVTLSDRATGDPINTAGRSGYVVLDGEPVNTSENGTVVETLDRSGGGVAARYEPGRWWQHAEGYVADSDGVYVGSGGLAVPTILSRIGVLISMYLFGVVVISRFTGWELWPPWRGL